MIVMKFGGTSVGDASSICQVINIVKSCLSRKPIVVVSAISQATNILHNSGILASSGELSAAKESLNALHARHLGILHELVNEQNLFNDAKSTIDAYFQELIDLLQGVFLLSELSGQSYAKIVSYGELLSTTIVNAAMTIHGIKNVLVDARTFMITDDNYFHAKPNFKRIMHLIPKLFNDHIGRRETILTQGFISCTESGIATTLGREGSDYSASIIGMAIGAEEIQIWTDVDGIMTSDPRIIKNAKSIPHLSFDEAICLACCGAKVLHPLTIKPAIENNIPIKILNSKNPDNEGTTVASGQCIKSAQISSIACKDGIKILNISYFESFLFHDFLWRVFSAFEKRQITVDVAASSLNNLSCVLDSKEQVDELILELKTFSRVEVEDGKALICIAGTDIKHVKNLLKTIFNALNGYDVSVVSYGASSININLVVRQDESKDIAQVLHDKFFV